MTMVYETRKVVEDYVLFKIKEHMKTASGSGSSTASPSRHILPGQTYAHFPSPQDPPSEINDAIRKVARDFEKRYKEKFPDLLEGVRSNHITSGNVDHVLKLITRDLFQIQVNTGRGRRPLPSSPSGGRKLRTPPPGSTEPGAVGSDLDRPRIEDSHVKWGHIIGLLVFTGILAVRCVEINNNENVDEIVNWVSQFLDSHLGQWLHRHGGWHGFADWYKQSQGAPINNWMDQYLIGQDIKTVLKVSGAVAAAALGFVMLTRK